MRIIVITPSDFVVDEALKINRLFECGLDRLHLRKPDSGLGEVEALLQNIDPQYYSKIRIHDYFELAEKYSLGGVHLNRRNALYEGNLSKTRSCHTLEELRYIEDYEYVFLSPVFNSISKYDYPSNFTEEELLQAKEVGLINERVMALGGISEANLKQVKSYGFGGIALLGSIWNGGDEIENFLKIKNRLNELTAIK